MLYLSDYKKYPKTKVDVQVAGLTTLDSLDANLYRTSKYNLSVEDLYTNSIYQCRFTVTHDSLFVKVSEFDVIYGEGFDIDLDIDAVYQDIVGGYPTTVRVQTVFPANFNGSWSLEKEVFINISQIQKDGFDGPSDGLYPSNYTYPNNS